MEEKMAKWFNCYWLKIMSFTHFFGHSLHSICSAEYSGGKWFKYCWHLFRRNRN